MAEQPVTADAVQPAETQSAEPGKESVSTGREFVVKHPDGREEKFNEEQAAQRLQKAIGLEKRVSDAAKYETAFNNFVARVQDPRQMVELLNDPNFKYDEDKQEALVTAMLASKKPKVVEAVKRWLYENEVKPSMMDPKEREAMEWKNKAEALESDKLKREKELREQEEQKQVAEIKEAYRVKLGEAYTKSGLPTDDFLVRQVMEKARLYVRAGKIPDFENCCKLVQSDFINQVKAVLGKATVDNILTYLDGETPKTINKALMKALKGDEEPIEEGQERKPRVKKTKERTPEERKKWLRNLERGIIE